MASKLRVDSILPVDGAPTDGGGGIIQVVHSSATAETSQSNSGTTQTTLTDTGLSATITPKFSTSKVLVLVHQTYQIDNGSNDVQFQINMLLRDGSNNVLHGGTGFNALRWKDQYAISNIYHLNFTAPISSVIQANIFISWSATNADL